MELEFTTLAHLEDSIESMDQALSNRKAKRGNTRKRLYGGQVRIVEMQTKRSIKKDYYQMWVRTKRNQCQKGTVKKMTETSNYTHTKDGWG